jgi:excinuclease UvrABC ATPase subunit
MSLIENLHWRHAVKAFDPNQSVSQENIDKIIDIDQSPIGRTPRSNPAT